MDRCPDGGGIGRGPVTYTQHDHWVVGDVVQDEIGRFSGEIVAHFGDNARIASVDVTGDWSWSTETRRSGRRVARHAVAGRAHSRGLQPDHERRRGRQPRRGPHDGVHRHRRRHRDLGQLPRPLHRRAPRHLHGGGARRHPEARAARARACGSCPTSRTVHVAPASTVPVGAHLTDSARRHVRRDDHHDSTSRVAARRAATGALHLRVSRERAARRLRHRPARAHLQARRRQPGQREGRSTSRSTTACCPPRSTRRSPASGRRTSPQCPAVRQPDEHDEPRAAAVRPGHQQRRASVRRRAESQRPDPGDRHGHR